jgi:hypothetical protein
MARRRSPDRRWTIAVAVINLGQPATGQTSWVLLAADGRC